MNDKERLNDIEGRVNKLNWLADAKGNATVDILAVQIDFNWLIETIKQQQKEIKELKIAGEFFETGYHQFEKENKRYREALEEGLELTKNATNTWLVMIANINRDALEGETSECT